MDPKVILGDYDLPPEKVRMLLAQSRENSVMTSAMAYESEFTSPREYYSAQHGDPTMEEDGTAGEIPADGRNSSDSSVAGAASIIGYAESVASIASLERQNTVPDLIEEQPYQSLEIAPIGIAMHPLHSHSNDMDYAHKHIVAGRVEDDMGMTNSSKRMLYDSLRPSQDPVEFAEPFITNNSKNIMVPDGDGSFTEDSPINHDPDMFGSPQRSKPKPAGPGSASIKSRLYRNQISGSNKYETSPPPQQVHHPHHHAPSSSGAGGPTTPIHASYDHSDTSSMKPGRSRSSSNKNSQYSESNKGGFLDRMFLSSMSTSQHGYGFGQSFTMALETSQQQQSHSHQPGRQKSLKNMSQSDKLLRAISQGEDDFDCEPVGELPKATRSRSGGGGRKNELDENVTNYRNEGLISKPAQPIRSNSGLFGAAVRWRQWFLGSPYRSTQEHSGCRVAAISMDSQGEEGGSVYASSRSVAGTASMRSVVVKTSFFSPHSTGRSITSYSVPGVGGEPVTSLTVTQSGSTNIGAIVEQQSQSGSSTQPGELQLDGLEQASVTSSNNDNPDIFQTGNGSTTGGGTKTRVAFVRSSSRQSSASHESTMRNKIAELDLLQHPAEYAYRANMFDIWAYCITTVIGGIYYGWNEGMKAGFGSYAIAQVLVGFAFQVLGCSLAEIMSTVSFSGGAYGMARVVLGFYIGFIVAVFEFLEYLTYTAVSAQYIGELFCVKLNVDMSYTPLFSLCFYVIAGAFVLESNTWFWRLNMVLALISLAIILIYCFCTLGHVDFAGNASLHRNHHDSSAMVNWFAGGMFAFMRILPFTTWGFGGLESAALLGDMTDNPRVNLSYGMAIGSFTLFFCTITIMFVASSLPPGLKDFSDLEYFMDSGFELIGINNHAAEWLIFPAQFAMAIGFILPSSKLLRAMSTSKLLPPSMFGGLEDSKSSHISILYVLGLSYLLCLIGIYIPSVDFENIPILLAQFTYLSDLYAFYKLRTDFSNRENKFRSPFGIPGVIVSGIMFILIAISVLGFQGRYGTFVSLLFFLIVLSIYYFCYAKRKQHFSDDEQKSLLVLHVIRNNNNKKKKKMMMNNANNNQNNFALTMRSISSNLSFSWRK